MMRYLKFTFQILLVFILSFGLYSCSKDKPVSDDLIDNPGNQNDKDKPDDEKSVTLDKDSVHLEIGDTLSITPSFDSGKDPQKLYSWKIANENVLKLVFVEDGYVLRAVAKKTGITSVTLISDDGKLEAKCIVSVGIEDDGIIRILAIGNSFSEDALEHYLYGLADAAGIKVIIGNLYIGGASLALHWSNASGNKKAYDYRKIDVDGNKTNTPNSSIAEVLASENWNYISLQQVSQETGLYNTYTEPFPKLYDYVKNHALSSEVKMMFHEIWAYQQTSTHSGFANYNNDQMTMYNAIVDAVWKAAKLRDLDIIVPSGTAIQNGRATLLGDNFNRDGYHLNALGQYTASCTWLEAVLGIPVIGNTYKPDNLTTEEAEIAQHIAHAAVGQPKKVTVLEEYLPPPPEGIQDEPVFIGFGSSNIASHPEWNAFEGGDHAKAGNKIENLVDYSTKNTGVSIEIMESFNAMNPNGAEGVNAFGIDVPNDIAKYSYYGNTGEFGGIFPKVVLKISGLDKDLYYDFCFYASRTGGGVRETKYTVTGANTKTGSVDVVSTDVTKRSVCIEKIQPDENGEVTVTLNKGDNNDQALGFFYLNFMKIARSADQSHGVQEAPVLIGFGSDNIANHPGWNAFSGPDNYTAGKSVNSLVDYNGLNTGVNIEIVTGFNERNPNGIRGITLFGMNVPDDVAGFSYYGNSNAEWRGVTIPESKLKITGLDKNQKYDFCFYGSRDAGGTRETKFIVEGDASSSKTAVINVVDGDINNRTACVEQIQPNDAGEVTVTIKAGDNNDTAQGFFYLNIMKISKSN